MDALELVTVTVVAVIVGGFVIQRLWSWFVVPLDVRPIGLAHACGLDALWFAFTPGARSAKDVKPGEVLARIFYRATAALLIGYIAHVVMQ